MFVVKHCRGCGKKSTLEVPEAGYIAWQQGTLYAREAFPDLTPSQIDTVLTGWHEECVEKLEEQESAPEWDQGYEFLSEQRLFDLESLIEG